MAVMSDTAGVFGVTSTSQILDPRLQDLEN
jgi:hypothetical protein